ncbi:methyltransferase domain-containing protein [Eggerthellaceae bacterium zg-887]|uniref:methyltransferase domain-containing protein n=1 Tax=Xiamenia xianingshaonis TaxID=2682776 RepID=UPI001409130F|nr:methyltransferase domain-containing protein [Xiamenia xianingshaonis]NHM15159.1 methyltransferase domain-containing protein [Xiamenia xianingshaonis]
MNITQAKQQITDTVRAYLMRDETGLYAIDPVHQRPVFLMGAPGIGKTAIMEQIASELGIGLVSYSMTHHTRQSALGLPRIEQRSFDGLDVEISEYTMSEIIAAIYDYRERTGLRDGILFLDEINCVSETLYPSMLQFLQYKTFGKHKVPAGWVVVCAGNPLEYNRSVHEFDIVTLDRLREIDVVPDYASWHAYALEKGLHPAVVTFLDAKKDCFYKVEGKPGGGKSFVTARGWEDLSELLALYERMEVPADRDLFAQFLRDDDICDQFSVYYTLFQKYRSDYQVDAILAGQASDAIKQRAVEAAFDERVALLGLLLDALGNECAEVLRIEKICLELRDVLRSAKEELLAGAFADAVLGAQIERREEDLARKIEAGTTPTAKIRRERTLIQLLRAFLAECTLQDTPAGEPAFETIRSAYQKEVGAIRPKASAASAKMDAAFRFVDETMGQREMLVFMAELTTRNATTQFVSHYGNESYYQHNETLKVDQARANLDERAEKLSSLDDDVPDVLEGPSVDVSQAVGLKARDAGRPASADPALDSQALADHYANKQFEYGFASVCKMLLPASDLKGKKVLDVGSRRGRGVYKISSMVGNEGRAIGIDWSPSYVQEAAEGISRAWHDSGLKGNNMEFHVAYPEDLISAGIGTSTMDVLYVNNVVTLFYDQQAALREFGRVLKSGGLLILETVFADRERDDAVVEAAREIGNSIQAARTEGENLAWLEAAGFDAPTVVDEYEVAANLGYKAGETVEAVPDVEDVAYKAVSLYVRKK